MGGASFLSLAQNDQRIYTCPYIDYANGTYDVVCPSVTSSCINISVTLTFLDFGAYRYKKASINRIVWSNKVCFMSKAHTALESTSKFPGWYMNTTTVRIKNDSHSSTVVQRRWFTGTRFITPLNQSQALHCLRNTKRTFYLVGDSHIRRVMEYWQQVELFSGIFNQSVSQLKKAAIPVNGFKLNWRFIKAEYTIDAWEIPGFKKDPLARSPNHKESNYKSFVNILGNWTTALPNKSEARISIVLSTGAWDLTFRNRRYFVKHSIPAFRKLVGRLTSELPLAKIYLWPPPSCPELSSDFSYAVNNAAVAACVNLLIEAVSGFPNVHIVDFYSMTLGYPTSVAQFKADWHYLRYHTGYAGSRTVYGEIGVETSAILLHELCDENDL